MIAIFPCLDSQHTKCSDATLTDVTTKDTMEQNGWRFSVSSEPNVIYDMACGSDTWYGYLGKEREGEVSATFQGRGFAQLVYGNCGTGHGVDVYLDSFLISRSRENRTEVGFQFFLGSVLTIKEVNAIIKLHSLSIDCFCEYYYKCVGDHFKHVLAISPMCILDIIDIASTDDERCKSDEFQCTNDAKCLPASWRCDDEVDCVDSSDEKYCQGCLKNILL